MSDSPIGPGDDCSGLPMVPAQPIRRLLERFAEESRATFIRIAGLWIRRLGIDEVRLAPEGAYDAAWVLLLEDLRAGKVEIRTREELDRVFRLRLRKVLFAEWRRQRAPKRGWGRVSPMGGAVPEVADPHGGRPDDGLAGRESVEWALGRLERHDPALRAVLEGKMAGHTCAEMAAERGVSVSTLERMFREIRSLLGPDLEAAG